MTLYERFIDITARKPSGVMGRRMYRNPRGHMISFRMLLKELNPTEDDLYAEIGCGGGALLDMALTTVKRAWAVDHSPDMVAMARENNAGAIAAGRLDVIRGSAQDLPWADESFTCITNANMFFFVEDPMAMLRECRRVLKPGGASCNGHSCQVPAHGVLQDTLQAQALQQ